MDIIKEYLSHIGKDAKTKSIDSYKIITVNDKGSTDAFLMYDQDSLVLNSKTLMKLLLIKSLPNEMLPRLMNSTSTLIKKNAEQIEYASEILFEDRIFFDFDPYGNFLLTNNMKKKDIHDIITKTTNYSQIVPGANSVISSGTNSGTSSTTCEPKPERKDDIVISRVKTTQSNTAQTTHTQTTQTTQTTQSNKKEYDLSRMVNPYGLEKVVFTGGGAKGMIYIGGNLGLLATGQVFYLNHFAGTSVGALTAMVSGCTTPTAKEYNEIKQMTLRDILTKKQPIVERYQEAMAFITERFCGRSINTFYVPPVYSFRGVWSAIDTIVKNNSLYDPQKSGFQIWYALICKKICQIMKNGLDKYIIIKKKDGTMVEFADIEHPYKIKTHVKRTEAKSSVDVTVSIDDYIDESIIRPKKDRSNSESKKATDELDKIKTEEENIYKEYCGNIDFDTDPFTDWELVRFFTYQEYYDMTSKTLVMTGTKTKRVETVYYTHTTKEYKNLSVMTGATASMSIPWVFKAPIIDGSYNLDGGLYDNYPLTHCDIKIKDKITHYNNKIFGYLIDDKSTIIDAYEIIRELWLGYMGFIEISNIGYLQDAPNYVDISELFFEIRAEFYKLLYFTDVDLETFLNRDSEIEGVTGFNIRELESIFEQLVCHAEDSEYIKLNLPQKGIKFIEDNLRLLDTHYRNFESVFKIGRKTDLADIMELSVRQGEAFNILSTEILKELHLIEMIEVKFKVVTRYEEILTQLMKNILAYYELKGTFIKSNDLECPSLYFSEIMKNLYKKMTLFEKLTVEAVTNFNKTKKKSDVKSDSKVDSKNESHKNYINNSIQITQAMISKILTRGSGNNIDLTDIDLDKNKSSYMKVVDYFFHTDMTGILYKYLCIANDRICNDSFNRMRTINLNTFETGTLQFDVDDELKARLIYEGYSKTIKYFVSLLHIMEMTGRPRPSDDYVESFELRYKKLV